MAEIFEKKLRVFGTKPFMRFAEKFGNTRHDFVTAVMQAPEADLGGCVCKFRIARAGGGKSGGARVIAAVRVGERVVMMYGFEKKDQGNITKNELKEFKKAARIYLGYADFQMDEIVKKGVLTEISEPVATKQKPGTLKQSKGGVHGKGI